MGTDGTKRLLGDGTLRVDLTFAAVVLLALVATGWLIRDELRHTGAASERGRIGNC